MKIGFFNYIFANEIPILDSSEMNDIQLLKYFAKLLVQYIRMQSVCLEGIATMANKMVRFVCVCIYLSIMCLI